MMACDFAKFDGRIIKVVDGPGVGDTRMDSRKSVNLVIEAMEKAMISNPRGYHAFLLVVRFGGRFTKEDVETIQFLKDIFGENFVRDFCILVLTCGDNFEKEAEEEREGGNTDFTFEKWCREQTGVLRELMAECNGRVLLLDNKAKDIKKKQDQLKQLIYIVDNLSYHGQRYTDDNFKQAGKVRERIIIESKKPMIKEETMAKTSLIMQNLQQIHNQAMAEEKLLPLEKLLKEIQDLHDTTVREDKETGALKDLLEAVSSLKASVTEELKTCHKLSEEKKRMQEKEEENKKRMEEEMHKQREDIRRSTEEQRRQLIEKMEQERQEEDIRRQAEEEKMQKEQKSVVEECQQLKREIEHKLAKEKARKKAEEERRIKQEKEKEEAQQKEIARREREKEEMLLELKRREDEMMRQVEENQEQRRREAEKERQEMQERLREVAEKENRLREAEREAADEKYQEAKERNDRGFFEKTGDFFRDSFKFVYGK